MPTHKEGESITLIAEMSLDLGTTLVGAGATVSVKNRDELLLDSATMEVDGVKSTPTKKRLFYDYVIPAGLGSEFTWWATATGVSGKLTIKSDTFYAEPL
jgi:hypothetical protein